MGGEPAGDALPTNRAVEARERGAESVGKVIRVIQRDEYMGRG